LAVQSYDEGAAYTQTDADVLAHVAHHVSGAIERMQAYEAMHRSEERYRNVIEQVGQGMMVLKNHRVLFANAKAAAMVDSTQQALLQGDWTAHLHPEDRERTLRVLSDLAQEGDNSSRHELRPAGGRRLYPVA
jgi:PAS domain S-box-containing protein